MLNDDSPMPFGKYKGKPMREVPAQWLDWFHGECDPNKCAYPQWQVLDYINRNRDVIDSEL